MAALPARPPQISASHRRRWDSVRCPVSPGQSGRPGRRSVDAPRRPRERHRAARRRARHRPAGAAAARLPAVLVGLAPAADSTSPTPATGRSRSTCAATARATSRRAATTPPRSPPTSPQLVTALGETDAMVVGNDVGGLLAWTMAAPAPAGGAPARRARRGASAAAARGDRAATGRAAPRVRVRAAHLPGAAPRPSTCSPATRTGCASCSTRWTRSALARHAGLRGRRRAVRRGDADPPGRATARRSTSAGWCARCPAGRPALRRVDARRRSTAPVLQLHGELRHLRAGRHRAGLRRSYVSARLRVAACSTASATSRSNEVPELVSGELIRWAKLG